MPRGSRAAVSGGARSGAGCSTGSLLTLVLLRISRFGFKGRKSARPHQGCQPKRSVVLQWMGSCKCEDREAAGTDCFCLCQWQPEAAGNGTCPWLGHPHLGTELHMGLETQSACPGWAPGSGQLLCTNAVLWDFKSSCFLWHGDLQGSLCVPEVACCAQSQARYFSARPSLLPPAGPGCSIPGS